MAIERYAISRRIRVMAPDVGRSLVIVMAMGTFVVVLDNTIMNVSISALVADLQTTVSGYRRRSR